MKKALAIFLSLLMVLMTVPGGIMPDTAVKAETIAVDNSEVTRAQWIQMLVSTFDMSIEEENAPDNYYCDLTGDEEYYRDILVAVEFGVIDLEAGLAFHPEQSATREFAAQTLNRCLGFQLDEEPTYTFVEAASVTYPHDLQIAVNRGWFTLDNGHVYPDYAITVAEKNAMLQDAENVLAQGVIDTEREDMFSFNDQVIVLPQTTAVQYDGDSTLVLSNLETRISANDIFVAYIDNYPLVFKAESVAVEEQQHIVIVSRQNINDYLTGVDAEGITAGNLADFEVAEGLDALYVLENGAKIKNPKSAGKQNIKAIYFHQKFSGYSVTVELSDMVLNWKSKGSVGKSLDVSAVVTGRTHCNISIPYGGSASSLTDAFTLGSYPIGYFGSISIVLDLSVDGSVNLSYGAEFSAGVEYTSAGGFRIPRTFKKTHFSLTVEANVKMGIKASAGITGVPMVNASCYATIGAQVCCTLRYRGEDVTPHLCIHTDGWLYAKAGVYARVGVKGIDEFAETWRKDIVLWDRNSSPVRSITHFEDGTKVDSCTYGDTNFGGYDTRYYSGRGSRYANGGVSAVVYEPTYSYTLDEDNNAIITGFSGGFSSLSLPATIDGHTVVGISKNAFKNNTTLRSIVLSAGITYIGSGAFAGCSNLSNITLSDALVNINDSAFANCGNLIAITIPDSVTFIGSSAFSNCTKLSSVQLSKNLKTFGSLVFENCVSLKKITIPKTVTECTGYYYYAHYGVFYGCTNLKTIVLEDGMTAIAGYLLQGSSIETITIPDSVTYIGGASFRGCAELKEIVIPDSVTYIDSVAFVDCGKLASVQLSKNLQVLGHSVFGNCVSLTEITIPKTVTTCTDYVYYANYGIFYGCTNLKTIVLEAGMTAIAGYLLQGSSIETITIPESVTYIGKASFRGCLELKEIVIPDSVTFIDSAAFIDCETLSSVQLSKNLQVFGDSVFENCVSLTEIIIPKTVSVCTDYIYYADYGIFHGCTNLKTIVLEEGMKAVPAYLLQGSSIETITIPEGVTSIGEACFRGCLELKEIVIPSSVQIIDREAFKNTGFTEFVIPDTVTYVGSYVFTQCENLEKATWTKGYSYISAYAFQACPNLKTVVLPDTTTRIGEYAFEACVSLLSFALPKDLERIDKIAFANCDAFTEVVIPDKVTYIGDNAFCGCDTLETFVMSDSITQIGQYVFYASNALKNVTLSKQLTSIPEGAFQQCALLEEIIIPYYVTCIEENAFNASPKLKKVVIPQSVTSIEHGAFSYANMTVIYGVPGSYAEEWANSNGFAFVANEVPATSIALNHKNLTMFRLDQVQLLLSITPADATDSITWKSSNTDVVTVDERGVIIARGIGTATIRVNVGDQSASCKITVVQPVTKIYLNAYELSLGAWEQYQLTATAYPYDVLDGTVSWRSEDENIVTVDENGMLVAKAKGTTRIIAEANDGSGVTVVCTVAVTNTGYIVSDVTEFASSHPYSNKCNDFWVYSVSEAEKLLITFDENTEMEEDFDYLYIYNGDGDLIGAYTGNELSGQTIEVFGSTVKIQIETDSSGNEWGFAITEITCVTHTHAYSVTTVLPTCQTSGSHLYTCDICGDTYTEIIPATGVHVYDDDRDADCNECGAIREVSASLPGDASGDGKVNNRDLGMLQQYINGWNVSVDADAADVTGDGKVNNRDLGLLQQYINGWNVELK